MLKSHDTDLKCETYKFPPSDHAARFAYVPSFKQIL